MKDVLVSKTSGAPDLDTLANAYIYLQVLPLLSALPSFHSTSLTPHQIYCDDSVERGLKI